MYLAQKLTYIGSRGTPGHRTVNPDATTPFKNDNHPCTEDNLKVKTMV